MKTFRWNILSILVYVVVLLVLFVPSYMGKSKAVAESSCSASPSESLLSSNNIGSGTSGCQCPHCTGVHHGRCECSQGFEYGSGSYNGGGAYKSNCPFAKEAQKYFYHKEPSLPFVGQVAPSFEAEAVVENTTFRTIDLKEYRGSKYVLLVFYPNDFTFVCPSEILAFDKEIDEFKKRDVQILGVSVDSKHAHAMWKTILPAEGGIGDVSFPLVSDITKNISRSYGVLSIDNTVSMRGLFLLDKKGVLQHQLVNNFPIGRNVEEALRVIDALQHTEQNGDVCPANWKLGKPSMIPNKEGVKAYFKVE